MKYKQLFINATIMVCCTLMWACSAEWGDDEPSDSGASGSNDASGGDTGGSPPGTSVCETGKSCGAGMVCNANRECVDGCYIAGTYYAHGATNPANSCQVCSADSETAWKPTPAVGSACDTGKVCDNVGGCVDGCSIGGTYYAIDTEEPSNPCKHCSASNTSAWTAKLNHGDPCGSGKSCNADGLCVVGCVIGNADYASNQPNPSESCERCRPAASISAWTPDTGVSCGPHKVCTSAGRCDKGCYVGSVVYADGAPDPHNECDICDAESSTTSFSHAAPKACAGGGFCDGEGHCSSGCIEGGSYYAPGASCGGLKYCTSSGTCQVGCKVGSTFVLDGQPDPLNECDICTAATSTTSFQHLPPQSCSGGRFCDGQGRCSEGCKIGDAFVKPWTMKQNDTCQRCIPGGTDWAVSGLGVLCYDGVCNSSGICVPTRRRSAASRTTCAVYRSGGLYCAGTNWGPTPVQVAGFPARVRSVSTGYAGICVVDDGGLVWCRGADIAGSDASAVPNQISELSDVETVSVGYDHACAVVRGGAIKCWGRNSNGQLGNGTYGPARIDIPAQAIGLETGARAVSAGQSTTCAIDSVGGVLCWGANGAGQLGSEGPLQKTRPTAVVELQSGVVAVETGDGVSCAATETNVYCWGSNPRQQMGFVGEGTHVPTVVPGSISRVIAMSLRDFSCALTESGSSWCWGDASHIRPLGVPAPQAFWLGDFNSTTIAVGDYHACMWRTTGSAASCVGVNNYGQFGNGTLVPTAPDGTLYNGCFLDG